jgi:CHAD domain-containing protein
MLSQKGNGRSAAVALTGGSAICMGQQFEFKLGMQEEVLHPSRFAQHMRESLPVLLEADARSDVKPIAIKARPAILTKDIAAEDAFRLTLLQCKWHIASNIAAVVVGRQVEGVHQMRVGFRRLRVALSSFGGDFRTPALEALKDRAKKMSAKLGPARDLDVFVEDMLETAAKANGGTEGLDLLRARAAEARHTAWDFAVAHVLSPGFEAFMHDLTDAIDRRIWFEAAGRAHATRGHMAFEIPAVEIANHMLDHRLKKAKKHARHLKSISAEKRHKLRITLKKLRYTAEFFAPLYSRGAADEFLRTLSKIQDILGTLNDVAVAHDTLARLSGPREGARGNQSALSFAAGMVYGWHRDRADHVWHDAKKRWKRLEKCEPFWER